MKLIINALLIGIVTVGSNFTMEQMNDEDVQKIVGYCLKDFNKKELKVNLSLIKTPDGPVVRKNSVTYLYHFRTFPDFQNGQSATEFNLPVGEQTIDYDLKSPTKLKRFLEVLTGKIAENQYKKMISDFQEQAYLAYPEIKPSR